MPVADAESKPPSDADKLLDQPKRIKPWLKGPGFVLLFAMPPLSDGPCARTRLLLSALCLHFGDLILPPVSHHEPPLPFVNPPLAALNHRRRREYTRALNTSSVVVERAWSPLAGLWTPASPTMRRHRCRLLFRRPQARWRRSSIPGPRWSGRPYARLRVGEAAQPGPEPGTPLGGERPARRRARSPSMEVDSAAAIRVHCPVSGCPCADVARSPGWSSVASMRHHIDNHLAGSLAGTVPAAWLQAQGRQRCTVCGLSVSTRHGIHPTCRPAARHAVDGAGDAADGHPLPSFETIQAGRTRTLRHVPTAARYLWGKVLTRALAAAAHHNDKRAWCELLMLPQCVLGAPPRAGRKHRKAAAAYTLDRLQRWLEGERQTLWDDRHQPPRSASARGPTAEQRRELAIALTREGFERKACNALVAEGLSEDTPATAAALRALHPAQAAPTVTVGELPLSLEVAADEVARALRSFPADTAPGPSCLRVHHLREAGPPGTALSLMEQLTAVVNLLARGQALAAVAPVLAGADLVAVPKPKGGVRPIAIGEVLRRLTGKSLMHLVRDDAKPYLWPAQVGVAVPSGAEAVIHVVRAWMGRHETASGKVLVKLDFANAFNRVSRQAVLTAATTHFPGLARWVAWCYQQPSNLRFGATTTIPSAGGVQQGDPLGPLLFAAALQPLAQELKTGPLDLAVFFLDDGVLAGDVAAVAAALAHVQQRGESLGLQLNLSKCETITAGSTTAADLHPHFPSELLRFVAAHTDLEDLQVGVKLLRSCASHCRLIHSIRCASHQALTSQLHRFDSLVRACFAGLTGLHLDANQWAQAARGLAQAGLGLRSTANDGPAAYLASVGGCATACRGLDANYGATGLASHAAVLQAAAAVNLRLPQPVAPHLLLGMKQKSVTVLLDKAGWQQQLASTSVVGRAVLHSEAEPGGRAWLAAVPCGRKRQEAAAFVIELRQRLGLADASADAFCPRCEGVLDRFSLHAGRTCGFSP